MSSLIDLTGQRFQRLLVLQYYGSVCRKPTWECLCDCGTPVVVRGDMLKRKNTQSCGCLKIDSATRHGHSHNRTKSPSKTYNSWQAMRVRCLNPDNTGYPLYGGVGILLHPEWNDFRNFLADMGERPPGTTIDRYPDPFGNYEPGNCRWATPQEQANNRRNTPKATRDGITKTLAAWAVEHEIPYSVVKERVYRSHWPVEKALTTPYHPYRR